MAARIVVDLPEGHKVYFASGDDGGLSDVDAIGAVTSASADAFGKALGSLGQLVKMLEGAVEGLAKRPDKVELEFGAKISGHCELWVVSGEGEADFNVTLSWGK